MPAPPRPRAILFDLYGTLIDIHTVERSPAVWRDLARFLRFRGLPAEAVALRLAFFAALKRTSSERHPEWAARTVFGGLLEQLGQPGDERFTDEVAQLFRILTIRRLEPFADALPALRALRGRYTLAIVSDAQRLFLEPELREAGLDSFFAHTVVSADFGYRKPDRRLFEQALRLCGCAPDEALMIGDNLRRDVGGAQAAGIPAIWLRRPAAIGAGAPITPAWTAEDLNGVLEVLGIGGRWPITRSARGSP